MPCLHRRIEWLFLADCCLLAKGCSRPIPKGGEPLDVGAEVTVRPAELIENGPRRCLWMTNPSLMPLNTKRDAVLQQAGCHRETSFSVEHAVPVSRCACER